MKNSLLFLMAFFLAFTLYADISNATPDIRGEYFGSYTTVVSNCMDSSSNGSYDAILAMNIPTQVGNTFSGTATGTLNIGGLTVIEYIQLSGTITETGQISGTTTHTFLNTAGEGTFTGQLNGDSLSILNPGSDTYGDICTYSRNMSATRAGITIGDIDDSGQVGLFDAILALQINTGISPTVPFYLEADINGDGKLGQAEIIYALQVVSELRPESDFTGIYNFSELYDLNISSGVALNIGTVVFEVTKEGTDNLNLQGTISNPSEGLFSFQIPLIVSSNTATLLTHPYPIPGGSGNLLEFLILSDGNNMVYTAIGQEVDNLDDISLSVASWLRTSQPVTIDSFVGNWSGTFYTDPNLLDTTNGFNVSIQSGTISKVDTDTISIIIDNEPLLFDVVNNNATLANTPVTTASAVYHAISLVTDGVGLSWYLVATELNDPTDVSVDIGLLKKQ